MRAPSGAPTIAPSAVGRLARPAFNPPTAGVVALAPAPAAGIFAVYLSMIRLFGTHFLHPSAPWRRPLMPTMTRCEVIAQHQPPEHFRELFTTQSPNRAERIAR